MDPNAATPIVSTMNIPWAMDPVTSSGFQIRTEVKASQIPGGGRGRYVLEDVPAGTVVRHTTLVPGSEVTHGLKPGTTVRTTEESTLTAVFDMPDVEGLPTTLEQIANFCGTPVGLTEDNPYTFHWTPCNYFNHSAEPNVEIQHGRGEEAGTHILVVAVRDIRAGEELFQDYRLFHNPVWFKEFCKRQGVVDTETLGYNISGPMGAPPTDIRPRTTATSGTASIPVPDVVVEPVMPAPVVDVATQAS